MKNSNPRRAVDLHSHKAQQWIIFIFFVSYLRHTEWILSLDLSSGRQAQALLVLPTGVYYSFRAVWIKRFSCITLTFNRSVFPHLFGIENGKPLI